MTRFLGRKMPSHYFKFLVFIFCIVFTNLSAQLAYFPPCCPVDWQGFYLSGQLGMGSDQEHVKFVDPNYFNTLGPVILGTHFKHKAEGFIGGGALGYHYQWGDLVIGVEGGAVSSNLK